MVSQTGWRGFLKKATRQKTLILMLVPALIIVLIFQYGPMYGLIIAFKNYKLAKGIMGSEWVGLKHFRQFLSNPMAFRLIRNTLLLGIYGLLWSFPAPLILALLINELRVPWFRRSIQTISYMPHFISTVVLVGMIKSFCSMDGGLFNEIAVWFGQEPVNFFVKEGWFRTLYIGSGIWKEVGWSSILYLAALSGVDPTLYEAAIIDGAGRFRRMLHISLPSILPTVTILLILNVGYVLSSDFEKVMLMYNEMIYSVADVINTYVYREGLQNLNYSYSAAVGIFTSIGSLILLSVTNRLVKMMSGNSLW